jgi:hypothetical protein
LRRKSPQGRLCAFGPAENGIMPFLATHDIAVFSCMFPAGCVHRSEDAYRAQICKFRELRGRIGVRAVMAHAESWFRWRDWGPGRRVTSAMVISDATQII